MLSAKEVAVIYETVLSSPGMSDTVKIDLRLPRKNVLLLVKVLQLGMSLKDQAMKGDYIQTMTEDIADELREIITEILRKSGMSELHDKLNFLRNEPGAQ